MSRQDCHQSSVRMVGFDPSKIHCTHGALTDSFGWFVQGVLAGLAFTCLILKRFCEPTVHRRPWIIWFYDTSKQGLGALVIHFANVFLAEFFHGDPCTWYIVSFLLDSSIGLFIIFVGIRLTQHIARKKGWNNIVFGEYGYPPKINAWLAQCGLYVVIVVVEKLLITLLIQLRFWKSVRAFIMSPITNAKVEVAIVVLIIPFIINVIMFWVTDNFLMHKHGRWKEDDGTVTKLRVQYQPMDNHSNSEAEILLSDEETGGPDELAYQHRHSNSLPVT
ncbi:store-operated calcium entry regulator STIMATE-like isoform X1 [Limulus polyphemus]|uniref:Store-operated calcium entry regulator STIMATE-like isoform X1 n=1 Tax=Limulus polyphemus TaxID=6850 RepID=A0ABM1SFW6_LIMPO|nr:store-operated calcium entry regulator STIMATE-like isoform X1 [Limulus polyphemus]XP_022242521.1 store-operated calcium entry regulator STIMATE-like isoform X1 [Limulus polyphemus]